MSNPDDTYATLKQAFQLIKAGERQQARKIIGEFLKINPRSADGWYLAALVTDEPEKKLKIVERVLEINPQHTEANKLLNQLTTSDDMLDDLLRDTKPPDKPHEPTLATRLPTGTSDFLKGRGFWIAIGVLVLLIIFGSIFVLGQSRGELFGIVFRASRTPIPNTSLPSFTPTSTRTSTPTSTPTDTPTPTLDLTETAIVQYRQASTAVAMTLTAGGSVPTPTPNNQAMGSVQTNAAPTAASQTNLISDMMTALDFNVIDAEYSTPMDRIIAISESPNHLHLYNPLTDLDSIVSLPATPLDLSVSPDGLTVAVSHTDPYSISIVDLKTAKVTKTINISAFADDILLAGNGWVYISAQGDPSDPRQLLYAINISTDQEIKGPYTYGGTTVLRLYPDGTKIYGAEVGISPDDIMRVDIGPEGFTNPMPYSMTDSSYHGDYSMCGNLWFLQDVQRIFTACGAIFRASNDPQQDMTFLGMMGGMKSVDYTPPEVPAIQQLIQAGNLLLGVPLPRNSSYDRPLNRIVVWNVADLTFRTSVTMKDWSETAASNPRYVFVNAAHTQYYVIAQGTENTGYLRGFTVIIGKISDL